MVSAGVKLNGTDLQACLSFDNRKFTRRFVNVQKGIYHIIDQSCINQSHQRIPCTEKALEAMVVSSEKNKKGADYYIQKGFIPSNIKKESISCLLEFAYDDWCIARMAQEM